MNYTPIQRLVLTAILSGAAFSVCALPGDGLNLPISTTSSTSPQSIYIDVNELLNKKANLSTELNFAKIKQAVLQGNKKYFIDFSTIKAETLRNQVKHTVLQQFDATIKSDVFAISQYKGLLMYTPLTSDDDKTLNQVQLSLNSLEQIAPNSRVKRSDSSTSPKVSEDDLPHVSFFMNEIYNIKNEECTFKLGTTPLANGAANNLCDSPNISLIYKVTYARSLKFGGSGGGSTPDKKVVRISIDDQSHGAGIHLNDKLDYYELSNTNTVLDGWIRDWTTDAIAQEYKFTIQPSNEKALIQYFAPKNLNKTYQHRDVSTWSFGATAGAEISDAPKGKLEASVRYEDQRNLSFDTQDYKEETSTPGSGTISFTWMRDQYQTADSLLSKHTDTVFNSDYQISDSLISANGYKNFIPNFDVVYTANPDTHGETTFSVTSSVLIRPIYSRIYHHYLVLGAYNEWQGDEQSERRKRVNVTTPFTVNWDNPVFIGGRPVNLQLGAANNLCINVKPDKSESVSSAPCELKNNVEQAFLYDSSGRYVSVFDTTMCLDASDFTKLAVCSANLSQVWSWKANSDKSKSDELVNGSKGQILANNQAGKIYLVESGTPTSSQTKTITRFVDIFNESAEKTSDL